jgi:hypothetical protein
MCQAASSGTDDLVSIQKSIRFTTVYVVIKINPLWPTLKGQQAAIAGAAYIEEYEWA